MAKQSTDGMNQGGGNNAVGKSMRPVPAEQPKVPASKEFNGHEVGPGDGNRRRGRK